MTLFRWSAGVVTILYISTLHVGWAWLLVTTLAAGDATPLALLLVIFHASPYPLALFLAFAALAAIVGVRYEGRLAGLILMLPQFGILVMSCVGGIAAANAGQYADLTVRPPAHILADQLLIILSAPFYLLAVFSFHGIRLRRSPGDI